ncbi:MAG: tetratricopeptide repeat protein [Acidobacteria bacterium]|nr:tetratricopeptide repeat protein [Acidobacteriota bacterium]
MNSKAITVAIVVGLLGLVIGFVTANSINRSEMNSLRMQAQAAPPANGAPQKPGDFTLDPEELKAKIAQADAAPDDFDFQKSLGGALYRYATMKEDTALLDDAARILERANNLKPKDYAVIVDLGNAYFDSGFFKKDPAVMKKARATYEKAIAEKPDDADVHADYALTYFLDDPPDLARAVTEFQKALKTNPKQERALQYLAQTYIRQGDFDKAKKTADELRGINGNNEALPLLDSQIEKKTAQPIQ